MGNRSFVCWRKRFTIKLNAKDNDGDTPLVWDIYNKEPKTADILRKHGSMTSEELKN